jgi:hypothetical protein
MPCSYIVNFRFDRTIRHVERDIILPVPYIAALHQKDASVQSLAKDSHLKDQLEEVVTSWEIHVTHVIESYLAKVQRIERPRYYTLLGCLYVYLSVCMCVYVCMYVCLYVCTYVRMYICMYVCLFVCTYVCIYVCMYVCMYVCSYVRMYVCMFVCFYVRTYVYICMYICMFVCMYVCR